MKYRNLLGPFRADAYVSQSAICVPRATSWPLVLWTFESPGVAQAALQAWQDENSPTFAEKVRQNLPLPTEPMLPGGIYLPKKGA